VTDYRNRIVGLEYVSARDIESHPGNWRDHPKPQVEALRGILAEIGIADAILAYRSERAGGKLVTIDGHLRKDAAPQTWPVLVLDVTDTEADYILATHDPLAAMAQADAAALDALLASVNSGDDAVQAMVGQMGAEAELTRLQDIGREENTARALGDKQHAIKPVIYAEQVGVFERAMRATGERNRGEALIEICQYYLDNHEKGQLDVILESLVETQSVA